MGIDNYNKDRFKDNDEFIKCLFDRDINSFPIDSNKELIKRSLLTKFSSEITDNVKVKDFIKSSSKVVEPSKSFSLKVKKALLREIDERNTYLQYIIDYVLSCRQQVFQFAQAVVVLVLVFALVFNLRIVPDAFASEPVTISNIEGEVLIIRDGQILSAKNNMALLEGDYLVTNKNAKANITFFNNTMVTVDKKTRTEIKSVVKNVDQMGKSSVDFNVIEGRVWTDIKTNVKEPKLNVNTPMLQMRTTEDALYNIEVESEGDTILTVIRNTVDVTITEDDKKVVKTQLDQGQVLNVEDNSTLLNNNVSDEYAENEKANSLDWIKKNIEDEIKEGDNELEGLLDSNDLENTVVSGETVVLEITEEISEEVFPILDAPLEPLLAPISVVVPVNSNINNIIVPIENTENENKIEKKEKVEEIIENNDEENEVSLEEESSLSVPVSDNIADNISDNTITVGDNLNLQVEKLDVSLASGAKEKTNLLEAEKAKMNVIPVKSMINNLEK